MGRGARILHAHRSSYRFSYRWIFEEGGMKAVIRELKAHRKELVAELKTKTRALQQEIALADAMLKKAGVSPAKKRRKARKAKKLEPTTAEKMLDGKKDEDEDRVPAKKFVRQTPLKTKAKRKAKRPSLVGKGNPVPEPDQTADDGDDAELQKKRDKAKRLREERAAAGMESGNG